MMQTQTGTPFYCPPEVFKNESYNKKCDIWSLGCVIYELTALKPPFLAKDIGSLQKKVIKGDYPKIPRHFSTDLEEVLGHCLVLDPKARYSAWELLQHKGFSDVKDIGPKPEKAKRSQSENRGCLKEEMLATICLPKNLGNLNRGMLPQKNYMDMSNAGSGSDYASVPVDRDEVRKSLNRRRAGKVVKSLDPYKNHDNTDNPKISKKLEMQDTKASQDFNNREDE